MEAFPKMKRIFNILALFSAFFCATSANAQDALISEQSVDLRKNTHYILLGDVELIGVPASGSKLVLALKLNATGRFLELARINIAEENSSSICEYFFFDENVSGKLAAYIVGDNNAKISSADLILMDEDGATVTSLGGSSGVGSQNSSNAGSTNNSGSTSDNENANSSNNSQGNSNNSNESADENSSANQTGNSKVIYVSGDYGNDNFSGRFRAISVSEGPKKTLASALAESNAEVIVIEESSIPYVFPQGDISRRDIEIKASGSVEIKSAKNANE